MLGVIALSIVGFGLCMVALGPVFDWFGLPAARRERARVRSEKGIRFGGRPLATAA